MVGAILPMRGQVTRENHYVPQWYQRGFLADGRHKLHVLNLHPASRVVPAGNLVSEPEVKELGPKLAFKELDLYTTRFGETLNDEIERFLFGKIDKCGADAVRAWIAGGHVQVHRAFQDFFVYMDAQKLRTPKGLDWILKRYQGLPHTALMLQMQAVRQMHCTMWSECVREIVLASKSPVKFLVSDHPVTVFHPKLSPSAPECLYPDDPSVELVGSQTIFALDANHCLILTNLEYAENPSGAALLARRTNARFRGESLARTDAFIRGRELSEAEVHAINLVLKSRARQYVAASDPAWLYPEDHCTSAWEEVAPVLLPRHDLSQFGGEIYIGYKDGTSAYRDKFGRTSRAHEFLAKTLPAEEPAPEAQCGCGSGIAYRDCCLDVALQRRPSWSVMSIRERNLALVRAVNNILQVDSNTSWLDVRRNLSDEQVRQIHEVFAALWPTDTRLNELLPSPQVKRSRALYLGMVDPRTISLSVTGLLPYVDELVIVNPFVNPNGVRPEFSPIHHPGQFREQTLRNVFLLMLLEPDIAAGRIHLIPDPLDYDAGFRNEILAISKRSTDKVGLGPVDQANSEALGHDEMLRAIRRLPVVEMKAYIRQRMTRAEGQLADADIDSLVQHMKEQLEEDPLALLDPLPSSSGDGEFKIFKGFSRETGLYVATLTGSFVYTDSDTQWARLHETDGVHRYEPDPLAEGVVCQLEGVNVQVPALTYHHQVEPSGASAVLALLREVTRTLRDGLALGIQTASMPPPDPEHVDGEVLTRNMRASVPMNGFQRTDVSRLVLTFGRLEDVAPVRLAVYLNPVSQRNEGTTVSV